MIKDYYQVFYGKVAEKTATLNKEQAKNSAEGLAYRKRRKRNCYCSR